MRRAKVGVLISGRGSNMVSLIEASRDEDCPYEVVLVALDALLPQFMDIGLAGKVTVNAKTLAIVKEMWPHERAAAPRRAQTDFQHARGGAFARGSRHMDQPCGMTLGP